MKRCLLIGKSIGVGGEEENRARRLILKTIDKKYFKNPEKYIPKGIYCYKTTSITYDDSGYPQIHTDICPFFEWLINKEGAYCHYEESSDDIFLSDQVKICNINHYTDEEMTEMNE